MKCWPPLQPASFAERVARFAGRKRLAKMGAALLAGMCLFSAETLAAEPTGSAGAPRIVNLYNFIRNSDYRMPDSEDVLFGCTRRQIELLKQYHLPATWALQYDALINPRYQKLLKEQLGTNDEIGAWWEIPEPLAKKAGINWRGAHAWDPAANVGFSPGYTPEERRRLVDVYMAEFKSVFGRYPKTVGSWFIDEVTLAYMAQKYGIVASCNCKDQIGTDFYTLWGGYWNQAYYPSRLNAYMPAQTRAGQIDVPVFRMLGSDPIYQHGTTPGLISLEPVYKNGGGGMPRWVDWFMANLIRQPCLAFAYTQAGQENSFGWDAMKEGLRYQVKRFAELARAGKIKVETLEQSGEWFRRKFPLTPATAVVALADWKHQGHKTVWYDSRFYRLNVLWNSDSFFIRDLHRFDQNVVSPTHDVPLKATSLAYETLPIVDWALWSRAGSRRAGMWPVLVSSNHAATPMVPQGSPAVRELNAQTLRVEQALTGGGTFTIVCRESDLEFAGKNAAGQPLRWAFRIIGGAGLKSIVTAVSASSISYSNQGTNYRLRVRTGACRQQADGDLEIFPDKSGTLRLSVSGD
jgi:hypothetical protein